MASPAGARAEISLRQRSLQAWPKVYPADFDEFRRATGTKLLIQGPAGLPVLNAEYKSVEEGPLNLNDWQHQAVAAAGSDDLPAFTIQFTHPEMRPAQPWAFRLWPLNKRAEPYGIRTYTEQHYVWLMFVLANRTGAQHKRRAAWKSEQSARHNTRRGSTHAQAEAAFHASQQSDPEGLYFDATDTPIWEWLGQLDGRHPRSEVWPSVQSAPIGATPKLRPHASNSEIGALFARAYGVPLDPLDRGVAAPVRPLNRSTVGAALRQRPQQLDLPLAPSIEQSTLRLPEQIAAQERKDRKATRLRPEYERMWADESPSADNRELYRR